VRRRLLNLLTALLLVAAIAVVVLWCRSYFVLDGVQMTFRADMVSVYSSAGTIAVVWDTGMRPMPTGVLRVVDEKPEPVGGSYWRALGMFDFGRMVWGGSRVAQIPHWTAIVAAATLPAARSIGRRRHHRNAGGFPIAAITP
jgi:hypothetical protein